MVEHLLTHQQHPEVVEQLRLERRVHLVQEQRVVQELQVQLMLLQQQEAAVVAVELVQVEDPEVRHQLVVERAQAPELILFHL